MKKFLNGFVFVMVLLQLSAVESRTNESQLSEWVFDGRDEDNTHFSPLDQINSNNVSQLGISWVVEMPTPDGMVGTPLVVNGVVYQTGTMSRIFANDIKTGKLLWEFAPELKFNGAQATGWGALARRGLAIWKGKVYVNTADCRLLAVELSTGKQAWEADVCVGDTEYTITSAPHVGAGKVFVGPANSDVGTRRGYVDAFDASDGTHLWRFYTIPGDPQQDALSADPQALERVRHTWGEGFSPVGGSVWESMHYDGQTNLLYIGVGGPIPYNPLLRGHNRGDELYSNSIVALDPNTGKYVWHYQVTPNDAWNWEPVEQFTTADLTLEGTLRRVLMQASKNGFFYILDAATGELIAAKNFVPVNWAMSIDLVSGRPIQNPKAHYYKIPAGKFAVKPNGNGGHGMPRMSFNPVTGLVYIPALDAFQTFYASDAEGKHGARGDLALDLADHAQTARAPLVAWNPLTQTRVWEVDRPLPVNGGTLTTAGNLVFQGLGNGRIEAYRADNGERLWSFDTGSAVMAAPVTVKIEDTQYLIISVGNGGGYLVNRGYRPLFDSPANSGPARLITFEIGGAGKMPPVKPVPLLVRPELPRVEKVRADRGALPYKLYCMICHGSDARGMRSSVPDLRRSSSSIHQLFEDIVIAGLLRHKGMPAFAGVMDAETARDIQAYIINRSWEDYESQ